jgi:hypothetical protein
VSDSADIFVVAPPRSGTTWVQSVLSSHPTVATIRETEVFDAIDAAVRVWGRRRSWRPDHANGLEGAITRAGLIEQVGGLWWDIRRRVLAARPDRTRMLEKTPHHLLHMNLIREVYGERPVKFVVVVRDPLAVIRSTLEAGASRPGALPATVTAAAYRYVELMTAGLAAVRDDDTIVVRYEDLRRGPHEWKPMFEFLGLDDFELPDLAGEPAELLQNGAVRMRDDGTMEPGTGTGEWNGHSFHRRTLHRELAPHERRFVEWRCGTFIRELGYGEGRRRPRPDDLVRAGWHEATLSVNRVRSRLDAARKGVA